MENNELRFNEPARKEIEKFRLTAEELQKAYDDWRDGDEDNRCYYQVIMDAQINKVLDSISASGLKVRDLVNMKPEQEVTLGEMNKLVASFHKSELRGSELLFEIVKTVATYASTKYALYLKSLQDGELEKQIEDKINEHMENWCGKVNPHVLMHDLLTLFTAHTAKAVEEAVAPYMDALIADASDLWEVTNAIKKEIASREWIFEGRGCYAWDDDRYKDETRLAFEAVLKLIKDVQPPAQKRFWAVITRTSPAFEKAVAEAVEEERKRIGWQISSVVTGSGTETPSERLVKLIHIADELRYSHSLTAGKEQ